MLPRLSGQFSVCPTLAGDTTPVTGRFVIPDNAGEDSLGALQALGLSAFLGPAGVLTICDQGGARSPFGLGNVAGVTAGVPGGLAPTAYAPPPAPPERKLRLFPLENAFPAAVAPILGLACKAVGCEVQPLEGRPAIMALADADTLDELGKMVGHLDKRPQSFVVTATVYEEELSDTDSGSLSVQIGGPGSQVLLAFGRPDDASTFRAGVRFGDLQAVLARESQRGTIRVLSQPVVRVLEGENARFKSGAEVPTLSQVVLDDRGGQTQGVVYREAGLIFDLEVAGTGDLARVKLAQELSGFSATTTGVTGTPTKTTRELKSDFVVPYGHPVLLGGLYRRSTDVSQSKLPFIRLPAGRSSRDGVTRVFMLLQVDRAETEAAGAQRSEHPSRSGSESPDRGDSLTG